MEKKNKKIIIMFIVVAVLVVIMGSSFAFFNYSETTDEQQLVVGDIYLNATEGQDEITLVNVFPETKEEARSRNDNFITFTLTGINSSNKTIYYEIDLKRGEDKESPYVRFNDADLVFDLVELDENDNEINYVVDAKSYSDITNKKIWVDTIAAETNSEVNKKYKLRAWLSDSVTISDTDPNATYAATDFKNHYATIKVGVFGDFNEKQMDYGYLKVRNAINAKINAETNACNPI